MSRELEEVTARFTDRVFRWQALDRLLGNQYLRYVYIWLFLIPVFAKATIYLPQEVTFSWQGMREPVKLALQIPFNWKLLYFSALFLYAARLLYAYRCPQFVRDYRTASDAISAGMTAQRVRSITADFISHCFADKLPNYESQQGQILRNILRSHRAAVDDIELQWSDGIINQPDVGVLIFDALERLEFQTDDSGNYVFDDNGTYPTRVGYRASTTVSREQFLKHQCWDLIEIQNISFENWRMTITLILTWAMCFAFLPLIQSVLFVLGVFWTG